MNNKEFLRQYPLHLLLSASSKSAIEEILKKANEEYVLPYSIEEYGDDLIELKITCETTNFAMAYYHIGLKIKEAGIKNMFHQAV